LLIAYSFLLLQFVVGGDTLGGLDVGQQMPDGVLLGVEVGEIAFAVLPPGTCVFYRSDSAGGVVDNSFAMCYVVIHGWLSLKRLLELDLQM
jgi:hypothetical protein